MANNNNFVDKLTDILVQQGSIKKSEANATKEDFYNRSQATFDFFLLDEGLVSKDKLLEALSKYYQVPSVDVTGLFFDHDLVRNFPLYVLLENVSIPYNIDQEVLTVISSNPADPKVLDQLENYTTFDIEFRVGLEQEILDAIREYYDRPPETYISDITDDDEPEDEDIEDGPTIDEMIDREEI